MPNFPFNLPSANPQADIALQTPEVYNTSANELMRQARMIAAPPLILRDTPAGRVLSIAPYQLKAIGAGEWVRITGATQDGSNYRWIYTAQPVEQTAVGYGNWVISSGAPTYTVYNTIEDQNGASGLFGNGVNSANIPSGMSLQPIPTGTIVRMFSEETGDGHTTYWCSFESAIDGNCS